MTQAQPMNTDDKLLRSYVQGHMMAAESGVKLFEQARQVWAGTDYEGRIKSLAADIEEDRRELKELADGLGITLSMPKKGFAWLGHTASRLNPLNPTRSRTGLPGQLELETLHSAVSGKGCLWATLERLSAQDDRIDASQQKRLLERAEDQQRRITEIIRDTAAVRFRRDVSL